MKLTKFIFILLAVTCPITNVFAHAGVMPQRSPMMFEIIASRFEFDNMTVKEAHIVQTQEHGYIGVEIELKETAAKQFGELTAEYLGKSANIVINNQIISTVTIQSALGPKLLVTGITKYDAVRFLNMLKVEQAKQNHKKPIIFK